MAETLFAPVSLTSPLDREADLEFDRLVSGMNTLGRQAVAGEAQVLPPRIEGRFNRRMHLKSVAFEGMSGESQRRMTDMIVDIGLPVDQIRTIAHETAFEKDDDGHDHGWNTLATWLPSEGRFTTYDALNELPEAARLATTVHELTHGVSPFREENAFMYGSEEAQQEAAQYAEDVAKQSLLTGVYINAYQKKNAEKLVTGEMTWDQFREETSAILTEHGLTNRAKLRQVQEAQQNVIDRLVLSGQMSLDALKPVKLVSDEYAVLAEGVDKQLVNLLDGVNTVAGIEMHTRSLKHKYQGPEDRKKSAARAQKADIAALGAAL